MTYEEATEATVGRQSAFEEIRKHSLLWCDFVKDVGNKEHYTGKEVLDWLGY